MTYVDMLRAKSDEEMIDAINSSSSLEEISRKLGVSKKNQLVKNYIKDFAKLHNIHLEKLRQPPSLRNSTTKEALQTAIDKSLCWSDVLRILQLKIQGRYFTIVKEMADTYGISYQHFDFQLALRRSKRLNPDKLSVFRINSNSDRKDIKSYIIKNKLIDYSCRDCKLIDVYNDKPLVLHLEHINGINNDNRLENLCFLCPNCHSQTNTYCGKNRKYSKKTNMVNCNTETCAEYDIQLEEIKKEKEKEDALRLKKFSNVRRPTEQILRKMIEDLPLAKIAAKYGVSSNAVKKWADKYNIETKGNGYWQKKYAKELDTILKSNQD